MSGPIVRGKPGPAAEIRPMPSPTGHAGVRVYHFDKSGDTIQVSTGTVDVPTFSVGASGPTATGMPEPVIPPPKRNPS